MEKSKVRGGGGRKGGGLLTRIFHSKSKSKSKSLSTSNHDSNSNSSQPSDITPKSPVSPNQHNLEEDTRDTQTGERNDYYTSVLHSIGNEGNGDDGEIWEGAAGVGWERARPIPPSEHAISRIPGRVWEGVVRCLELADEGSLMLCSKVVFEKLDGTGRGKVVWDRLREEEGNVGQRLRFLSSLDYRLPGHVLCFSCLKYHRRLHPGQETLKPRDILNPVYDCPHARDANIHPPTLRITPPNRTLPFTFIQLSTRSHRFGESYGIPADSMSRRWKDRESGWSHQTRYIIHNNHLLMRVISTTFATPGLPPSGLRYLLYTRSDFTPYFSACAHWRDGLLMTICKCALGHIPIPPQGLLETAQNRIRRPPPVVSLCSECQPMRRCPECPTEYLVEIKLVEDRSDPVNLFKQALVVTRWSDLGDGKVPTLSPEWCAINGGIENTPVEVVGDEGEVERIKYDSFRLIGQRAISGIFEGALNGDLIPGQRILSLNPKGEKLGEKGSDWY